MTQTIITNVFPTQRRILTAVPHPCDAACRTDSLNRSIMAKSIVFAATFPRTAVQLNVWCSRGRAEAEVVRPGAHLCLLEKKNARRVGVVYAPSDEMRGPISFLINFHLASGQFF